ncbi:phosphate/phosphite/phosphonate ABC transporter substrate-binding protein [Amycolatopsis sp. FDAARGOS 1241]|uniref:phosphate/phosphite/phosphonate ABC transporter substrate-binding protein n=1 Tax=Amycolatopsis sp. FDAARGOS 1241 TaxID=2778070 RepID=UPI00194F9168|nr:phosphate/phosphite/phosphonate ABC transporter substrate-binding protein [Amycolatopsis sp. FDAARGOS 1241]QRP43501.1 phosphate/phosphite/phosphonate ABC transporter substrate-binding protein [Amycolatopsis sp. FDAARGOS 1241]
MSRLPRRPAAAVLGVAAAFLMAACGQSAATNTGNAADGGGRNPDELVLAAVPSENAQSLQQAYQPIISLLQKETGKKVRFQSATDYAAVIEAQRTDKVDIAQYGPLSYVLAKNSGVKASPIAAQTVTKGAEPGYKSYGITKAGSPIKSIADFKGKKICFVDPNSTSGYLYPKAALLQAGIDPAKDITPVMTGGHDASVLAVNSGQCDAGFAEDSMVDKILIDKGQLKPGDVNTVWKSDVIAGSPVAISDDLAPDVKAKITDVFQNKANVDYLNANGFCATTCKAADDAGDWGYVKVDDTFYAGVRKVCATTKDKQCTAS